MNYYDKKSRARDSSLSFVVTLFVFNDKSCQQ